MIWRKFRQHKLSIVALVLILSGLALRLFFIAHNYPATDSEEGTMGLEALHMASKVAARSRWLDWIAYSTWGITVGMGLWSQMNIFVFMLRHTPKEGASAQTQVLPRIAR